MLRRLAVVGALLCVGSFVGSPVGAGDDAKKAAEKEAKNHRDDVEKALRKHYNMQKRLFGLASASIPSDVAVMQQHSVVAKLQESSSEAVHLSMIEDGKVVRAGGGGFLGLASARERPYRVGEQVYITKLNVDKDGVVMLLRSIEPEKADVRGTTYVAFWIGGLKFKMDPEWLARATPEEVVGVIRPFVITQAEAASLPPPTVALGQTPEEVTAITGKPDRIVDLGQKQIYVYKDMKVVFVSGKVADVQ
jgi:hypothetical protein